MTDKTMRWAVRILGVVVFIICLYAFLLGNKVFNGGFDNDGVSWYFLAKGIFCSVSMFLSVDVLWAIRDLKKQNIQHND